MLILTSRKLVTNVVVVQGVTGAALQSGAGHYPNSALPGEIGNTSIEGHRRTYGRPFVRLGLLRQGDTVLISSPFATYTYALVPGFGGHPNPWVARYRAGNARGGEGLGTGRWLTLTTSVANRSGDFRLIARLKQVKRVPSAC
jgi:sortase A